MGLEDPATPVVLEDMPERKVGRRAWARLIYQVCKKNNL